MTINTKCKLPNKVYCPYHAILVRSCEHRDEGLLDGKFPRFFEGNIIDGLLNIHNQFSHPDSQFYKGDKEMYKKFKKECRRLLIHFGYELP